MFKLTQIKIVLMTAGISRLQIQFDDKKQLVNAEYIFRGKAGTKQLTYQEIVDGFTIGLPGPPISPGAALAERKVDGQFELKDLHEEK